MTHKQPFLESPKRINFFTQLKWEYKLPLKKTQLLLKESHNNDKYLIDNSIITNIQ